MSSRAIALIAVLSLLAGIVQLPLPAVAATAATGTAEHSHHHCCPKLEQAQTAAVIPALPSLPCGPNHTCCTVRAPAKLPSTPAGSRDSADCHSVRIMTVNSPAPRVIRAVHDIAAILLRSPLDLGTVLRI